MSFYRVSAGQSPARRRFRVSVSLLHRRVWTTGYNGSDFFSNKVVAHGFMFSVTKYATDIFRNIPSSTPLNEYLSWMNSPYLAHGSIKRTVMSDETVSGLRWLLTCCTVLLLYHNDSPVLTAADRTRDSYVCNSEVLLYCFCFCVHCEMRVIQSHLLEQKCYKIKCWLTERQIDWQT